ncbi:MAG: MATE family efflux transporter [Rhodobacteraceae bacterium]|nr:MATE family efflux transporter [Paracoccaceae bacterium]
MVFSTLYNVVDVYFAGLLSTDAQAGLGITFQVFFFLIAFGVGLGNAMSALIGNALGADDRDEAKRLACQGIGFAVILSFGLGVTGIWGSPAILGLVSEPGAYRDAAVSYMNIILFAAPAFLLVSGMNGILSATGDTQTMKRAQIAAFFANIVLNPLFIFGVPGVLAGIGFDGIALSTLVSQYGVLLFTVWRVRQSEVLRHPGPAPWRPDLKSFRDILAQALPTTFAMMILLIAGFFIQYYLKSFGAAALAAYGVALRIEQLILLPAFGLTGALLPIAAQNYGAKNFDRVREAVRFCCITGVILMLIGSTVLWFAARPMMAVFTNDPDVIRIGGDYLHVDGFILPVYILVFTMNAFLQAVKRPMATLWIGVYRQGIAIAVFTHIFVTVLGLGTWGVWFAILASVTSGLILSLYISSRVANRLIGGLFVAKPNFSAPAQGGGTKVKDQNRG